MSLKEKIAKIDADIEKGLKFKAADRLRNLIQENPNEEELWNRLAELYYESGFLDAAGRYWILTEPTNERIKKSVAIYEKSVNYSGYQILQEIVFRGDKSKLNKFAQNKLNELEASSKEKANYIPKFAAKKNKPKKTESKIESFREKLNGCLLFAIVGAVILLIIIGFISVVKWLF